MEHDPLELKARRKALGLTQDDLAALIGVRTRTLSLWETNKTRKPHMRSIRDWLKALKQAERTAAVRR